VLFRSRDVRAWAAALAATLAVGAAIAAPVAAMPAVVATTTSVYMGNNLVARLEGDPQRGFTYGVSGECWVDQDAAGIAVGITHSTLGGAVRVGARRWHVWEGRRLVASLVRKSPTRWQIMRRSRRVGHTLGPYGPAAATAYLILGPLHLASGRTWPRGGSRAWWRSDSATHTCRAIGVGG
jgi:hypothetical protein